MSELTSCNYCDYKRIVVTRKDEEGKLVTTSGGFGLGGINIHFVKPGEEPTDDNFVAWFMELTDHCVC